MRSILGASARVAQLAEAADLNPAQCGFDSHPGHSRHTSRLCAKMPRMPDVRELAFRAWRRTPVPPAIKRAVWRRLNPPSRFVSRQLAGMRGIEIGASAHNDYALQAINVDRYAEMETRYKREEAELCGRLRPVDLVAPGNDLPLADASVDFVFASHVIEHFPDPVGALEEWRRVARSRVVVVVPHRDRTFDAGRPLSTPAELLERHATGFTSEEDKHWSVWTCESFLELCDAAGFPVLDSLDPDDKMGNGFIVVLDAAASCGR
jgi:SAM-dependent methyltransferase